MTDLAWEDEWMPQPESLGTDWQAERMVRQGNAADALEKMKSGFIQPPSAIADTATDEDWAGKTSLFNDLYAAGRSDLADAFSDAVVAARGSSGITAAFTAWQHPRAKDGRFIEVGKWVRGLFDFGDGKKPRASRGQVVAMDSSDMEHTGWVLHIDTPDGPATAYPADIKQVADVKGHLSGAAVTEAADLTTILQSAGVKIEPTMRGTLNGIDQTLLWQQDGPDRGKPTPLMQAIEQAVTAHGETLRVEVMKRVAADGVLLLTPEQYKQAEKDYKAEITALDFPRSPISMEAGKALLAKAKALENNRALFRAAFAKHAQTVLGEKIKLGGTPNFSLYAINGNTNIDAATFTQAQQWLTEHVGALYPTSWWETHNDDLYHGTISINVNPSRGYYNQANKYMRIPAVTDTHPVFNPTTGETVDMVDSQQKAVHEFGHRMEDVTPALRLLEYGFYWRRVGDEKASRLRDVYHDPNYKSQEIARRDGFATWYMGKDYGGKTDSSWELFTMGMELLVSSTVQKGSHGATIVADQDYQAWLLGTLATLGAV